MELVAGKVAVDPQLADRRPLEVDRHLLSAAFVRVAGGGSETKRTVLDEGNRRPGHGGACGESRDDASKHVVRLAASLDDLLDPGCIAHASRSSPSKVRTAVLSSSGTAAGCRCSRSMSTSVWCAVTMRESSGSR